MNNCMNINMCVNLIIVPAVLDYETAHDFVLTVTITDGGTAPTLSTELTLTVAVTDVNEGNAALGFTSPVSCHIRYFINILMIYMFIKCINTVITILNYCN